MGAVGEALPASGTGRALEGAGQVGGYPASVKIALLGFDSLIVDVTGIHS